jgi:hypothetical protein
VGEGMGGGSMGGVGQGLGKGGRALAPSVADGTWKYQQQVSEVLRTYLLRLRNKFEMNKTQVCVTAIQ